jgi:hypothetical protein
MAFEDYWSACLFELIHSDAQRLDERRARTMVPTGKAAFARPFHLKLGFLI